MKLRLGVAGSVLSRRVLRYCITNTRIPEARWTSGNWTVR